jgi:DNA polymerase-3 subunit delta'
MTNPVPVVGHRAMRERLLKRVQHAALPASLLLHGPKGVGKQRLALWLGAALLCETDDGQPCGTCRQCRLAFQWQHPDLHWVFPRPRLKDSDVSPKDIVEDLNDALVDRRKLNGLYPPPSGSDGIFVATVRAILQLAAPSPAMARRRVFVIGDAERMVAQEGSDQAANAFLKLLEEPPSDTTIILTSSEPGSLLPTIRSRVVAMRVAPLKDQDMRAFLDTEGVRDALKRDGVNGDDDRLLKAAAGAPGALFGAGARTDAVQSAQRLLDAAVGDRAALLRAAFTQGASGARGVYADTLDALTDLLAERLRDTATERPSAALATSRAMMVVERAKAMADNNANPQLVTASLLGELAEALA